MFEVAGLQQARAVSTPFPAPSDMQDETPLEPEGVTKYKCLVGRLLWVVPVRPDIAFVGNKYPFTRAVLGRAGGVQSVLLAKKVFY